MTAKSTGNDQLLELEAQIQILHRQLQEKERENKRLQEELQEKKAGYEDFKESEIRFRAIAEYAHNAICIINEQGKIVWMNDKMCEIAMYPREIILEAPTFEELIAFDSRPFVLSNFMKFVQGEPYEHSYFFDFIRADGQIRSIEKYMTDYTDRHGNRYLIANMKDITDQRNAEIALHENRLRLIEAQRIGGLGDWEWDPETGKVVWSDETYRIFGVEPGTELSDAFIIGLFHPEDRAQVEMSTVKAIHENQAQQIEARVIRPSGEVRYVHGSGEAILNADGKMIRMVGVYLDVTERKLFEEALKESEDRYRMLLETMNEGVMFVDNEDRILFINQACCDIYGYQPEELIGRFGYEMLIHPDDREFLLSKNRLRTLGVRDTYEIRGKRVSGEDIWVRISGAPIYDKDNKAIGSVGLMSDITQQRHEEEARKREEEFSKTIIDSIPGTFYMIGPDGNYVRWNSYQRDVIVGKDNRSMVGHAALDTIHPEDRELIREKMENVIVSGREEVVKGRVLLHGGPEYRWFLLTGRPLMIDGQPHLIGTGVDISERVVLEEQLAAAQKMEAIGLLAGGIAHDFNNLLTVIVGYGDDLLKSMVPGDGRFHDALEIVKAGKRASNLTRQLLTFSRKQILKPEVIAFHELVYDMEKLMQRLLGENITIQTQLRANLDTIKADRGQLEQVIINLAVNSRDAMAHGGSIIMETENQMIGTEDKNGMETLVPGSYLALNFTDTGLGMTHETLSKIFEPFFTTKEKGKGLGLGLSTVYGIIHQAGGDITVSSEFGVGTKVRILLPITSEKVTDEAGLEVKIDLQGKGETILVVEDEEAVCFMITKMLRKLGYHVESAFNGNQALEMIKNKHITPGLIISDVIMPGMDGLEMASKIHEIYPGMKILLMSGFTDHVILKMEEGIPFIQKPFEPVEIAVQIRKLLGSGVPDSKPGLRILQIDDDENIYLLLRRASVRKGHSLDWAPTPSQAYELLAEQSYDVLLVDMNIPGSSGDQIVRMIRDKGIQTPIIILSGSVGMQSQLPISGLGVIAFLEKSFDNNALLEKIENLLIAESV